VVHWVQHALVDLGADAYGGGFGGLGFCWYGRRRAYFGLRRSPEMWGFIVHEVEHTLVDFGRILLAFVLCFFWLLGLDNPFSILQRTFAIQAVMGFSYRSARRRPSRACARRLVGSHLQPRLNESFFSLFPYFLSRIFCDWAGV
jgi:hypothetical protein